MVFFSRIYVPRETHFTFYDSVYCEGGKPLEQVVQRTCGYPSPGSAQGQNAWNLKQPGLVKVSKLMVGELE